MLGEGQLRIDQQKCSCSFVLDLRKFLLGADKIVSVSFFAATFFEVSCGLLSSLWRSNLKVCVSSFCRLCCHKLCREVLNAEKRFYCG